MIERDYYPLEKVAEIFNYSQDDLIYLGASGKLPKLPIYILTPKFHVAVTHIKAGLVVGEGYRDDKLAKLACYCLQRFEAGDRETRAIIEPEPFLDMKGQPTGEEYRFTLKWAHMYYPSMDELRDTQRKGINIDDIYPPVRILDCVMVIMTDDLKRLQESQTPARKRKHMIRATSESLALIDQLLDDYKVEKLSDLLPVVAWGYIISGEYQNDLIKEIIGTTPTKKKILLNGGELVEKPDFLEKYRSRFEKT